MRSWTSSFRAERLISLYGHAVILVSRVQAESADTWHGFTVHFR